MFPEKLLVSTEVKIIGTLKILQDFANAMVLFCNTWRSMLWTPKAI